MNLENTQVKEKLTAAIESSEDANNILDFPSKLRKLRKVIDPGLIKRRETRLDGIVRSVDYIEWHTVADILDETASSWTHSVKDVRQIGGIVTVIVAITIDGVTREGMGTGAAKSETGIKKAEHDALKRAAVKFGIARDLYRRDASETVIDVEIERQKDDALPNDPMARTLSDLVTGKQLRMIYALYRELGLEANDECDRHMGCRIDELSKKAASDLIGHLQNQKNDRPVDRPAPLRRAG
ncbi:MAG: hypothetical protein HKN25_00720 [Pyrinomonadaceae bacterium]|nr:hypothetical protein [Pyrinomonadaceae bacterium]